MYADNKQKSLKDKHRPSFVAIGIIVPDKNPKNILNSEWSNSKRGIDFVSLIEESIYGNLTLK